ncbi:spore germination protein [Salirhabdus euzebyi]|uniref:Spore germination protein n=1 Tax=Salirhabdus euzebyi TaxID=394506 RepID=A0A841Q4K2_9BACI|nr:Ger(x)C family spore germination protein [Salirhabdus euzebyi]MBB6453359.1 spore germination protein [Salirhabdus euzebyi]
MNKWISYPLICIFLLILAGCWDRVEIEERGFVIAVGLDKAENGEGFELTQQIVVPGKFGPDSASGGSGDAYLNITRQGETMFEIIREVAAETSRSPFYEHFKLVIISSELAEEENNLPHILDHFIRYHEMRRATKVMIAKGSAKEILEVEPKNERLPAIYIDSISVNNFKNSRMVPVSRIGDLHEQLLNENSYTIQKVEKGEETVKVVGNAVIEGKTNSLIGFLEAEGTEGMNFLTGEIQGGIIKTKYKGQDIVYDMKTTNHKVKTIIDNQNNVTIEVKIQSEGSIGEALLPLNFEDPKVIESIEQQIEQEIKDKVMNTFEKVQEEFKVDIFGFGNYLEQQHYQKWQEIKKDWEQGENYFSQSTLKPKVNIRIRRSENILKSYK